jgi:uncharacterized protein
MSLFFGLPVLVKMGTSLGLILLIHKLSRSLLAGIVLGTLLLAFWAGHSLESALQVAGMSFFNIDSFMLLSVIVLVIILSSQMSAGGMMKELVGAVQARINRRASVAVLPALIGLLPMPGGALFSAPLVDDCDTDGAITPLLKTRANYWFRHIWEFWWPIYPGALLAIELAGIHVWQYIIVMFPLTFFSILAGYLFILRQIPRSHAHGTGRLKQPILPLILPIVIVLLTYIAVQLFLPGSEKVSTYLPMLYGLVLAVLYVQIRRPLGAAEWKKMIFSRRLFDMVAIVAVIKIYGAFVEAPVPNGTVMIDLLRSELDSAGIPAVLLIVLLPFVSAITTGLSVGFVGTSFPVVLSLLGPDPTALQLMQVMPFAYGIGYMGMMLSPVHVCLVVTNSHFKTGLGASLKGMLKPVLFTAAGICIVGGAWQLF